jgi:hypothetical protein
MKENGLFATLRLSNNQSITQTLEEECQNIYQSLSASKWLSPSI